MKILFVHEVSYEHKAVFEMHEFPELLMLQGHDVLFLDFPEDQKTKIRTKLKFKTCPGRAFPEAEIKLFSMPNFLRQPFGRLFAFFLGFHLLRNFLRQEMPDVIILYGVPTNGIQTLREARKIGIPVIHRAIDISHLLRPGFLSKFVPLAETYVFKNSNLILANNQTLARYISQKAPNQKQVEILIPGVKDIQEDEYPNDLIPEFDFVFMGTLFRFSGLDWFIKLLATKAEYAHRSLLVIGSGESEYYLRDLVTKYGIGNRISFTGHVEFENLQSQIQRGQVAILPFNESMVGKSALPGKVFQYIKFSRPVISTRLDGLMSVFKDGEGVIYADPGDQFMFMADKLRESEERRFELVNKGHQRLMEISHWPTVISRLEQIIDDCRQIFDSEYSEHD